MDTIFALASARGKAGVAVIRISGSRAFEAVETLSGPLPFVRKASVRKLVANGVLLDEALVLIFESGASFTGETSAELQIHGGAATIKAVIAALGDLPGLRLAEPGEFTRRALENGRLDLTQVEGLADVIDAETEAQRRQAFAVMSGSLGQRAQMWRVGLMQAQALLTATIDFSDEDIPDNLLLDVGRLIDGVRLSLGSELQGAAAAERIRDGFEVAIVGAPNVGKSTLLNVLAGREAAITSEIAGTTRDIIEVKMDLGGLPVTLLDTAGLRETDDQIERIGVDRALSRARFADLRVFLREGDEILPLEPTDGDLLVQSKDDLGTYDGLSVSGHTGQGVSALVEVIEKALAQRVAGSSLVIRERHRRAIATAEGLLVQALDGLSMSAPVELVSADISGAVIALEVLIGRVGVEDLLGEIFSRFCIGK